MQWHCIGERAKLTTHYLLRYQAGLELFPYRNPGAGILDLCEDSTDLLASLKTMAFLCFQIHQRVRITSVCALLVPELVSW